MDTGGAKDDVTQRTVIPSAKREILNTAAAGACVKAQKLEGFTCSLMLVFEHYFEAF